jgi:hypothetical protein
LFARGCLLTASTTEGTVLWRIPINGQGVGTAVDGNGGILVSLSTLGSPLVGINIGPEVTLTASPRIVDAGGAGAGLPPITLRGGWWHADPAQAEVSCAVAGTPGRVQVISGEALVCTILPVSELRETVIGMVVSGADGAARGLGTVEGGVVPRRLTVVLSRAPAQIDPGSVRIIPAPDGFTVGIVVAASRVALASPLCRINGDIIVPTAPYGGGPIGHRDTGKVMCSLDMRQVPSLMDRTAPIDVSRVSTLVTVALSNDRGLLWSPESHVITVPLPAALLSVSAPSMLMLGAWPGLQRLPGTGAAVPWTDVSPCNTTASAGPSSTAILDSWCTRRLPIWPEAGVGTASATAFDHPPVFAHGGALLLLAEDNGLAAIDRWTGQYLERCRYHTARAACRRCAHGSRHRPRVRDYRRRG